MTVSSASWIKADLLIVSTNSATGGARNRSHPDKLYREYRGRLGKKMYECFAWRVGGSTRIRCGAVFTSVDDDEMRPHEAGCDNGQRTWGCPSPSFAKETIPSWGKEV